MIQHLSSSLVPRPSHHLVFDHMNDISVYLGGQRRRGVPHRKNELEAYLIVSAPSAGVSNVCEVKNIPLLVRNKEWMCKMQEIYKVCK